MDSLECKICNIPYDEDEHRPLSALCGHDICSTCRPLLTKDNSYECPRCRQRQIFIENYQVLSTNFGLVDVIREFNEKGMIFPNENVVINDACQIHQKPISSRCLKCKIWICYKCLDFHSALVGCSTIRSSEAMNTIKNKCIKNVNITLAFFNEDLSYISSMLQDGHTPKRRKLLHSVNNNNTNDNEDEKERFQNLLDQGKQQKEHLMQSINKLKGATNSPLALTNAIDVLTYFKQVLRHWSITHLGNESIINLLQESDKNSYVESVIRMNKRYAKISHHEERIYFNCFCEQKPMRSSICMPFNRLQKIIYEESSLMFLELKKGELSGCVLVRLYTELHNIKKNLIQIFTGLLGVSLIGSKLKRSVNGDLNGYDLPFTNIPVIMDESDRIRPENGEVIGCFKNGYLSEIRFYLCDQYRSRHNYTNGWRIFGNVESGMDIINKCKKTYEDINISKCGLVIE